MVAVLLFLSAVGFLSQRPVDLSTCTLAHGFVIGQVLPIVGAIEIRECPSSTVAALIQMEGEWPNQKRVTRSRFSPEHGPGEQLMGCRSDGHGFDGTVAIAAIAEGRPEVRLAWKADLDKWEFAPASLAGLVCNKGLTVN